MLDIVVQPSTQVRPGVALYPPVIATLSAETNIFDGLSQRWAVVTLFHYTGEVLENQLGGKVADSAHPMPERAHGNGSHSRNSNGSGSSSRPDSRSNGRRNGDGNGNGSRGRVRERAYFFFPDLVIADPGHYRIRVSLMRLDNAYSSEGTAIVEDQVDSQIILVEDSEPAHITLSESPCTGLRLSTMITEEKKFRF